MEYEELEPPRITGTVSRRDMTYIKPTRIRVARTYQNMKINLIITLFN